MMVECSRSDKRWHVKLAALGALVACSRTAPVVSLPPVAASPSVACDSCLGSGLDATIAAAIERRIVELRARGGDCARYGEVLDRSYRARQINVRPYMWRVGGRLAAASASVSGDMSVAREIDSLNVGLRTIDEILWSLEHEAAHIAFGIESPTDGEGVDRANEYAHACRNR